MIKYSLGCDNEHEFEGWFGSGEEFVRLQKKGLVDCPVCGSVKVEKLLMSPSIPKKSNTKADVVNASPKIENHIEKPPSEIVPSAPTPPTAKTTNQAAVAKPSLPEMSPQLTEVHEEMLEKVREFKKHVVANSEDVGENFVEEARKIHFGESEKRGIYGKANIEEATELVEEGVEIVALPDLPEDRN